MTKKSDDLTFNYFDMFVFCKQCRKMQIENLEDFGTSLSEFVEKFTCNTCSPRYEHELKKNIDELEKKELKSFIKQYGEKHGPIILKGYAKNKTKTKFYPIVYLAVNRDKPHNVPLEVRNYLMGKTNSITKKTINNLFKIIDPQKACQRCNRPKTNHRLWLLHISSHDPKVHGYKLDIQTTDESCKCLLTRKSISDDREVLNYWNKRETDKHIYGDLLHEDSNPFQEEIQKYLDEERERNLEDLQGFHGYYEEIGYWE